VVAEAGRLLRQILPTTSIAATATGAAWQSRRVPLCGTRSLM